MTNAAVTGRATRRRPADRRERIVAAAGELFGRHGFHNVSMADVASAVGITASALYRHFRNKQDLLLQVVTTVIDTIARRVADATDLASYLRDTASGTLERRDAATLWQREARHLPEERRAELRRALADIADGIAALITRERPGLARADAELLAWAVLSVFGSVSGHRFALPRRRFEALLRSLAGTAAGTALGTAPGTAAEAAEVIEAAGDPPVRRTAAGLPPELAVSRRERLLDEAVRLFDERGFQSVSTDDIGQAADVTGPSLYRHFPSKNDLLVAAVVRAGEQRRARTTTALAEATGPADGLALLLRSYVGFASDHSHLIGMLIGEIDQLPEKEQRAARQAQRDYLALWLHVLDQVRPGLDPAEAKITVSAVLTVVDNAVRTGRARHRRDLGDRLAEIGTALLLPAS
ncbi:TetR/AcrR family transcriptional regulator [Streptomyces yaizuensis]|uniref:TetR/AcrR family transcriptional regulator n=1 Tax=Streptomyces yaizuensis TaxID=2989713 RepID=A0ABQ5P6S8_9ACTN|nr:TetR family transcriptional regulator [Streptomyces sp. YSPA8]GLF97941.1 TetR/AcrR family transcriptional regulator [Streptomyces sp. YSPA8]